MPANQTTPTVCSEVGHHCWESRGLDIADTGPLTGELVSVKECVWCGKRQNRRY